MSTDKDKSLADHMAERRAKLMAEQAKESGVNPALAHMGAAPSHGKSAFSEIAQREILKRAGAQILKNLGMEMPISTEDKLVKVSAKDFLDMAKDNIEGQKSEEFEEQTESVVYFNDEDLENKTYIVRIEVRDNITGEKTERGKIKFVKENGSIKVDADAGIREATSPVETAHGLFFTHMIQATKEFIEDDLSGDN